ncbi:hypothetical protein FSP39_023852 [Pinctada imbricata]|uniref:PH domain-containing protein n=1 Tax=Pinctada imbricata TaxID=66713 RepID=A0AA88Y1F1_PINIB|nr:hypothetical protein FSP39_023852 [Pinctada imbricata]
MNGVREMRSSFSYEWTEHYQLCGILHKKPFHTPSNKWYKRFFLVKDGYLFYYPESERKEMEKRKCLNIHPKGKILLAAESGYEREKWIGVLEKSKRINWTAAQLADGMIKQLEEQGLQMAKQKQDYFDQLQTEVMALSEEKEKSQELERVKQELELEKQKLEQYQDDLMREFEQIKQELEDTAEYMKNLEDTRIELTDTISQQQENLKTLAEEKQKIMTNLKERESQNVTLHQSKEETEAQLQQIERKTQLLLEEKSEAERRLLENENRALMLEEEKKHFSEHAQELNETIKDLKAQKEMTETELREEVIARMDAERKLKEAEESLMKLGVAVESQTPNIHQDVKEEMVVNVGKLRRFFDGLAAEAKLDSDKPIIMKNSLHARKTLQRKAKTKEFQRRRSSSEYYEYVDSILMHCFLLRGSYMNDLFQPTHRCLAFVPFKYVQINFSFASKPFFTTF